MTTDAGKLQGAPKNWNEYQLAGLAHSRFSMPPNLFKYKFPRSKCFAGS